MNEFEGRLKGGHPNSLGNAPEIVDEVLKAPEKFGLLFDCYFSDDEVVRLRVSNAMKRIAKENLGLLIPWMDRFLNEISEIAQASAQWTLAQLFLMMTDEMNEGRQEKARTILKRNLTESDDWIVLKTTMDTLGSWSADDADLQNWLRPHLESLKNDTRKAVAGRAQFWINKYWP